MTASRMLADIRNQPASLGRVLDYQFGAGRSAMHAAARLMKDSKRILLTGMGASLYAVTPLADFLTVRGFDVHAVETSELLHYRAPLCRGAAVVLVSRSGNTVETAKLIPMLREMRAHIVGITNETDSVLAGQADETVLLHSLRDEMIAVQTYTGTVLTTLLLGAAVAGEPEDDWRRAGETAATALSSLITAFETRTDDIANFLREAAVVYCIGRGPSLASVYEGALLFNETAKLPAVAAPAGTFRHGPVEVVSRDFHGIVFATQQQTHGIDLALAADLQRMGAHVRTVAADGSWPVPNIPAAFLPVVEIVPLQFAALRAAELRSIRPGEFRYVSQVTTSESGFKV